MARRKYVKENNLVKAINTDSLELQKPLVNEYYDINVHNSNMDKIDLGYKQNKNDISNINYELSKTENTKYSTENGVKEFECKNGYVDNIVIEGQTKILNAENIEVEAGTDGAKLVSVGQGDKIEVLTQNSDETKQDKKQILTTLRSLPNGVKDTIEKRGNKYYKVKRCGEYCFNIIENSKIKVLETSSTNTVRFYIENPNGDASDKSDYSAISDKYVNKNMFSSDTEGFFLNQHKQFYFRILKSKLSSIDVAGVVSYFAQNPVTVVYELETPIITELPNFNPQTFEGDTTLLINSGVIQGEADFEVTNSMGSEIEVLKDKVSSLDDYVREEEVYYPSLLNGFVKALSSDVIKVVKNGNICSLQINATNSSNMSTGTIIAKLPLRFAPKDYTRVCGLYGSNTVQSIYNIDITLNGEIIIYKDYTANSLIRINASWEVK